MTLITHKNNLVRLLILLTVISFLGEIFLLWINSLTTDLIDSLVSASITNQLLHNKMFMFGLMRFVSSQVIVHALFILSIWYLTVSLSERLKLSETHTCYLGVLLWFVSYLFVFVTNDLYSTHSFFATLLHQPPAWDITETQLHSIFKITGCCLIAVTSFSIINLFLSFYHKKNVFRHSMVLVFLFSLLGLSLWEKNSATPSENTSLATQPNIIIIGLDAVRPDFVSFYDKNKPATPNIDQFLESSTSFSNAYATLARTFPSWASILTGKYPIHNHARGNNTDLETLDLQETLPKILNKAGYQTIYGTDDTRFNNTNELFGFDRVITPPMGVNDFLIGTVNDFPLSNLIVPTSLGKLLFPYNYANHGTAITYDPKNFMQLLSEGLHQRDQKPLFLAVHFTISHWPFYWFHDKQAADTSDLKRYQRSIIAADDELKKFLNILQENKLLDHSIVVLLSDHGTSLGLPGDRVTQSTKYQGHSENIKLLPFTKYAGTPEFSLDFQHDYGVDTSYGYGGDVLSLNQFHTILAIKSYGFSLGKPSVIHQPVSLTDLSSTLLSLTHLDPMLHTDGESLTPLITHATTSSLTSRDLFFETSFTLGEIEKENINVSKVLEKTIQLYQINPKNGLIYVRHAAETRMNKEKQQGLLMGPWFLAHYPPSERESMDNKTRQLHTFYQPGFLVLVNLQTGEWTTEMNSAFAKKAPSMLMLSKMKAFFGDELLY